MKGRIVIVGILMIVLFSSFAVGFESGNASGRIVNKIYDRGVKGYTPHNVIRINNDTDFANQAAGEGWSGNGTQGNPYIISGYDIDAHGSGAAIYIGNTTVYFMVENCYLHNASYQSSYLIGTGITLYNTRNGKVVNNSFNNPYSVYLHSSSNNTILNNTCSNSFEGIIFEFSNNNTILNNTCSYNYIGIILYSSNNNMISNNTCSNNAYGIYVQYSINDLLYSNTMYNCGVYLDGNKETFTTQEIPVNNTVNNKSLYYYKNVNMNNATVPSNAGEIILGNVSYLKIENLTISHTTVGIESGYSTHITIENSTFSSGIAGITFYSSSESIIFNSTYSNNSYYGIYLYSSSDSNMILNNTCFNNFNGMQIETSSNNTILNNTCSNNNNNGVYLYSSSNNTISSSTYSNNKGSGIVLADSNNNIIISNLISNNTNYGIDLWSGSYNLIYNNSFYYNHGSGDVYDSSHIQASDSGSNNYWNTSAGIGNYWHDWANNNDTNDQNNDGIVDWPYKISGSKDNYPLKNATYPMPKLAPTAPRNLQAVAGDGYVNLTWQMPLGNGSSPIIEYRIYRNGTFIASVPANQLYYNDTNVVNGQTYTYYVTAVNSVGESAKSNQVQATPSGAVPEFSPGIWVFIVALIFILGMVRFRKTF